MATIHNSKLIKEIIDRVPLAIADKVVPVMETNPKILHEVISLHSFGSATGTVTITPNANKIFHLQSVILSLIKDSTCDMATGNLSINTVVDGRTNTLMAPSVITLTAQQIEKEISLNKILKLDKGSLITLDGAFTLGVCVRSICVTGYYLEEE